MGWGSVGRGGPQSKGRRTPKGEEGKGSKALFSRAGLSNKGGKADAHGKGGSNETSPDSPPDSPPGGFYFCQPDNDDEAEDCLPDYSELRAKKAAAKEKEQHDAALRSKKAEAKGTPEPTKEELENELEELKREVSTDVGSEDPFAGQATSKGQVSSGSPAKKQAPTISLRSTQASKASCWNKPANGNVHGVSKASCWGVPQDGDPDQSSPTLQRTVSRGWKPSDPNEQDDLIDPAAVFSCCDTDCSGALDSHELRFALNAFGLFPDIHTIEEWMCGQDALSLDDFRDLIKFRTVDAPESIRRPRAIPYSRRGISFGQLTCMNRVFLESGWLQNLCDKHNAGNRDAIEAGTAFSLGSNLYSLDRFLIRPVTTPEPDPSAAVPQKMKDAAHLPLCTHKVSYSELINPRGVRIHFFVSHWWGHPFPDTMKALGKWSKQVYKRFDKPHIEDMVYWLCFLALNQHRAGEEVGSTPEEGPFNAALMQAQGAIMILDDLVRPFERIWCLFEVKRLTELEKEFELICGLGRVGTLLKDDASEEAKAAVQQIGDALESVSAFGAGASNIDDKYSIWHRIADPRFRKIPLKTLIQNSDKAHAHGPHFEEASFKRFDATIRGLLAAPLFSAALKDDDPNSAVERAMKYLALGASFGQADLQCLERLGCKPCTMEVSVKRGTQAVQWKLLHCAAFFGHNDGITHLVQQAADINAKTRYGYTPLKLASSNGQATTTECLLELGAQLHVKDKDMRTELHAAALQGCDECVDVLLRYRADPEITDKTGETALHAAVTGGHYSIVEHLLLHRANLDATGTNGYTALHFAARDNHVDIAELLFTWFERTGTKEEVLRKKCKRSCSALELADSKGHEPMAELLRMHSSTSMSGSQDVMAHSCSMPVKALSRTNSPVTSKSCVVLSRNSSPVLSRNSSPVTSPSVMKTVSGRPSDTSSQASSPNASAGQPPVADLLDVDRVPLAEAEASEARREKLAEAVAAKDRRRKESKTKQRPW